MDWQAVYHFLFETYAGIGVLVGAGIVLSLLVCVIMERRTRKTFVDRAPSEDDWSFFDDDDEEEEKPASTSKKAAPAKKAAAKAPATKKVTAAKAPAKKVTAVRRANASATKPADANGTDKA